MYYSQFYNSTHNFLDVQVPVTHYVLCQLVLTNVLLLNYKYISICPLQKTSRHQLSLKFKVSHFVQAKDQVNAILLNFKLITVQLFYIQYNFLINIVTIPDSRSPLSLQELKRMELNCLQYQQIQMAYRAAQRLICLKYSNQGEDSIRQALQNLKESYIDGRL